MDLKTQQGTLAWWFRTVQYGFNYVLQQVMNSFTLPQVVHRLRFLEPEERGTSTSADEEDQQLAETMVTFCRELVIRGCKDTVGTILPEVPRLRRFVICLRA